jgi:hypothetical protein
MATLVVRKWGRIWFWRRLSGQRRGEVQGRGRFFRGGTHGWFAMPKRQSSLNGALVSVLMKCPGAAGFESESPTRIGDIVGVEGLSAYARHALKARRQGVNQKAPDELFGIQSHGSGLVAVLTAIVLPLKRDAAFGDAEDAVIGQRHAMRVAAQILNGGLRASKGFLRIDDPFGFFERIEPDPEGGLVLERCELAEERQLVVFESSVKSLKKEPSEQA